MYNRISSSRTHTTPSVGEMFLSDGVLYRGDGIL